jgi:hypothetical protein
MSNEIAGWEELGARFLKALAKLDFIIAIGREVGASPLPERRCA